MEIFWKELNFFSTRKLIYFKNYLQSPFWLKGCRILGPSFEGNRVPAEIAAIVGVYLDRRQPDEGFGDAVARLGVDVFKRELYAPA